MKPKLINWLIYIPILFIALSCEYSLKKENYKDIAKPTENPKFDLALTSEMDTIGIYTQTELSYNFNGNGLEKKSAQFSIDGKLISFLSDGKTIQVYPRDYQEGYHVLSLIIYTGSGTGSIADISGVEGYKVEKKWVLYVSSNPSLLITKTITKEGYLKLSWQKLKLPNFQLYEINFNYNNTYLKKEIYDLNSNVYLDSSYVGGNAYFSLACYYNSKAYGFISNNLNLNDSLPTLHFEDISADSIRIYWKKSPYAAKYTLINTQPSPPVTIMEAKADTSCKTLQSIIGIKGAYWLYISPKLKNTATSNIQADFKMHGLGTFIASYPDYEYNSTEKVFYANNYSDAQSFDIITLKNISTYGINNLDYTYSTIKRISCPTNSSKVAVLARDNIYVFDNKLFQNKVTIPYSYSLSNTIDYFCLTNNGLIAIAKFNTLDIVSVDEKKVVATLPIVYYPNRSAWASISMSKDGNNICIVSGMGIKLYSYNAGNVNLTYSDSCKYRSAMFDPEHPNRLLITYLTNNNLEIRDVSDFSVIDLMVLPKAEEVIRNIDPETGNLMVTDYNYLYVINMISKKIIFTLPIGDFEANPLLFGNTIFSNTGYALNISRFLAH